MLSFLVGALAAALVSGAGAQAADLKAPFELESTKVLPAQVRNPRLKNLVMTVDTRFNGIGEAEPLGNKLNKAVTWADIADSGETPEDKETTRGFLEQKGIDLQGLVGSSSGQVSTLANVMVPVLAMGVTDRWTLALAVPIYDVQVNVDTGFRRAQEEKKPREDGTEKTDSEWFFEKSCETNPEKCADASMKLQDPVNSKLRRLGYEELRSHRVHGMGDMKIVNKFLVRQNAAESVAIKMDFTLPTGTAPNADKALDVPTGDGQTDLGFSAIYDRELVRDLRWNTYGGVTVQLGDRLVRRIPDTSAYTGAIDSLSADKELVDRNLGDIYSAGTSLNYDFVSTGLNVGAGYSFQFLTAARYQGTRYADYRYRLLEGESPVQALHSATVMAGFSTVNWYKKKTFVYPFQVNLAYSHPLAGRNVTRNDVAVAELVLFF
jgi:hypothetical protein